MKPNLTPLECELFSALVELVLTIAPDYSVENQEPVFREPLKRALAAIKKAETK